MKTSEHPEFPQATPEMKYVVEQVSKIEDAQACATGYYKSLGKVLSRLDKTDIAINQLKALFPDSDKISETLNLNSLSLCRLVDANMNAILDGTVDSVSTSLSTIKTDNDKMINGYNGLVTEFKKLIGEISLTNKKLDAKISELNNCIVLTPFTCFCYIALFIGVGIAIGKYLV